MSRHYKLVALEEIFCPIPSFTLSNDATYTLDRYERTPRTDPDVLHERVHDADVIILTTFPLSAATLAEDVTPKLRLIAVMSVGTDCVDLEACRRRGITVMNSPGVNKEAVAQHAVSLWVASRRKLVQLHRATVEDAWAQRGSLVKGLDDEEGNAPYLWQEETAGVFGYGAVGQRIASICSSLGMKVLIAGRPSSKPGETTTSNSSSTDTLRTPFDEVLRRSTVIFLSLPRTPSTLNLISGREFSHMQSSAILVNVSRGGIVDEPALISALRAKRIAGAATDVFETEPAGLANSPLLAALKDDGDGLFGESGGLPLIVSPHTAWYSSATMKGLQRMVKENVEGWCRGEPPEGRVVV